uniref:Uncharacterized protein n=1 Tax=Odontella aurita TaxID=265563 RepID=A0A7S4I0V5_9STRA
MRNTSVHNNIPDRREERGATRTTARTSSGTCGPPPPSGPTLNALGLKSAASESRYCRRTSTSRDMARSAYPRPPPAMSDAARCARSGSSVNSGAGNARQWGCRQGGGAPRRVRCLLAGGRG